MKQTPWFDEKTGKRRGVTVLMSLKDDADFARGMKRVKKLLGLTDDVSETGKPDDSP